MAKADTTDAVLRTARALASAVRKAEEHGGDHQAAVARHVERLVQAVEAEQEDSD